MRVLVIDDSTSRLNWFQDVLEAMGHDVRTASDPQAALDQFHETSFDLAFFDHDLGSEPNGSQIAGQILRSSKFRPPRSVWIHSSNVVGADNIASKFRSAGIPHIVQSYDVLIKAADFRTNVEKLFARLNN